MNKKLLGFVLAGAVLGVVIAACGDGETPSSTACTSDSSCSTGEICHPLAKICVQSCQSGSDCPSTAKNCDSLTVNGTASAKFCQCSTTALCGGGSTSDTICAAEDKICTSKCTTDSACGAGRKCVDGDCKTSASNTDAGNTDAGTCGWGTCSSTSFSSGAQTCTGSGCAAGASCSGSGQSTCASGEACVGGACGYPPRPANSNQGTYNCVNFYSGGHSGGPVWNPGVSTGPVIYDISEISHGTGEVPSGGGSCTGSTYCQCFNTETEWKIKIKAYRNDTAWPATRAGLSGFKYVSTSGNEVDLVTANLLPNIGYNKNSDKDAEFNIYLCSSSSNLLQPGFYFTGGNEACRSLP